MPGLKKNKPTNILFMIALVVVILVSGCSSNNGNGNTESTDSQRNFYIGMVPTPKTIPETTFEDITKAYEEVGRIAEVTMIWGSPGGIGLFDKLKQNQAVTAVRVYGLKPVLTLNFHTIKEVSGEGLKLVIDAPDDVAADASDPEFRDLWVEEAKNIAQEFRPEYLSLGNEINDYFYLNPNDVEDYLTLFDEAYKEIKKVSPGTKVFVVFSYTHLIENNQWELLETFDKKADLIGLTTYPWKHFDTPDKIDENYYSRLNQYTTKPIAFTEIGWPSTSSEAEQAEFLTRFLGLIKENNMEMVNWLFLHEMDVTQGIGKSVFSPETGTISLKKADGTKKEVYEQWEELYLGS